MRWLTLVLAGAFGAGLPPAAGLLAQTTSSPGWEIRTASDSPLEQRGREQLARLVAQHDLRRWRFTDTVLIQSRAIPHSHPVLTLSTQYVNNDTAQVATFLHEQLHWFLVARPAATDSAIHDLRALYPRVPGALPEGARDEESTYLHLLVCLLEYDAVSAVFSEATARQTLAGWRHYTWVYREILEHPEPIRQILRAHELAHPDAPG